MNTLEYDEKKRLWRVEYMGRNTKMVRIEFYRDLRDAAYMFYWNTVPYQKVDIYRDGYLWR
jgi:hypothetical protein